MQSTIEATHHKFLSKINNAVSITTSLHHIAAEDGGVVAKAQAQQLALEARQLSTDYSLSTVSILSDYYKADHAEDLVNDRYYKKVTIENFVSRVHDLLVKCKVFVTTNARLVRGNKLSLDDMIATATAINIELGLKRSNYELCKCGAKMVYFPDVSERRCSVSSCGRVKIVQGSLRDDNALDGQKSKCNGYDFGRHLRFWMERLQAQEHKIFDDVMLDDIRACMSRDHVAPIELTCVQMRAYLKETAHTAYNDHVPLLVVTFGGRAPPRYDFQEVRDITIKFNKIINYYHKINPNGSNRPYYPYFIYKIVEEKFCDNPEKLRLLDYIHLQSEDTIKKNDGYYAEICKIAQPEDKLVYRPTNPYTRRTFYR